MIRQLSVEAAFRDVSICDLIGDLIMRTLQAHAWVAEAEPAER